MRDWIIFPFNSNMEQFIKDLKKFGMIDRRTCKDKDKLQFVTELCRKMTGQCENIESVIKDEVFEVYEFETEEDEPFEKETYDWLEDEVPNDVKVLAEDVVRDMVMYKETSCYIQRHPFRHLDVTVVKPNEEWELTMTIGNEDYYCEEFDVKLRMTRTGKKKFNVVLLDCKRTN